MVLFATGSASVPSAHAHALMNTPQPQQQLALMPANQSLMWGNSANASLPGVHFFCTGMEQLRSISDAGSVVSASSRKRSSEHAEATAPDNPSKAVPKFSPGFFQVHPALHLAIHQGLHPAKHPMLHPSVKHPVVFPSPEVERLIEGASDPQSPPPTRPPKITSSRLGVSGSTAADNADMPKTDMSGCANWWPFACRTACPNEPWGTTRGQAGVCPRFAPVDDGFWSGFRQTRHNFKCRCSWSAPSGVEPWSPVGWNSTTHEPHHDDAIPTTRIWRSWQEHGSRTSKDGVCTSKCFWQFMSGPPGGGSYQWWEVDSAKDDD